MIQLLLHLIGDYITQSDWMANNKTKNSFAAFIHATTYSLPFLLISSWTAFFTILITHWIIDRFRIAKYIVFIKNFLGWPWPKWSNCNVTGYPNDNPIWLSVWLLIIADNTLHLIINYLSLTIFPK